MKHLRLFADDTNSFTSHTDPIVLKQKVETTLINTADLTLIIDSQLINSY